MALKFVAVGVGSLAAVATCCSAAAGHPEDAFDLYAKSLQRTCSYNVCAIIEQRIPMSPGWERVKVVRDKRGRVRKSVIAPLSMEGVESVDDGDRWETLLPDDKVLLDQESPQKEWKSELERLKLAKKNYLFSIEGESFVAGRRAYRILAHPTHDSVDTRRYYLDRETLYPLKLESWRGTKSYTEFSTIDVSYPKGLDNDIFQMPDTLGMKVMKFDRPESVPSTAEAQRRLGFGPLIPHHAPCGFELQEMQIARAGPAKNARWRALVLRFSDGLVRATVYEYSDDSDEIKMQATEDSSQLDVNGVRLLLVSTLSGDVRERILASFSGDE